MSWISDLVSGFMKKTTQSVARRAPLPAADLTRLFSYRISVLSKLLAREGGAAYLEAIGLALPQWRVVSTLGHMGELAVTAIAEHTMMDRGQTSRTLDQLIAAGLVRMRPDINDGRRTLFSLSSDGEERYRAGMPVALERQKRLLEDFDPREIEDFSAMLDAMIARLSQRKSRS